MQLTSKNNLANKTKKIVNVNTALAAATCALLGTSIIVEAQETVWEMDTALLYYGETDRVTALEGVFSAKKDFGIYQATHNNLTKYEDKLGFD